MDLTVDHVTTYRFDPPMRGVVQSHRLTPSSSASQTVRDWKVEVEGASIGAAFRDGAGDRIHTVSVLGPVESLTVSVRGRVVTSDTAGVLRDHRERIRPSVYLSPTELTRPDAEIAALAEKADAESAADLDRAHGLAAAVRDAIAYVPGETHEGTTAAEALAAGQGVCQDHAHVLIAAALSRGLPARYVTGYLHAGSEEGMAEASHAWAEIHVADLGWVGFDAANGMSPDETYIRLGSGSDARDAAPIRGVSSGVGREKLSVEVSVSDAGQ